MQESDEKKQLNEIVAPHPSELPPDAGADTPQAIQKCSKCGAELQEGQDFCPKCGFKAGAVYESDDKIKQFNEESKKKKAKKKKKAIIITVIVFAVLAIGAVGSYFFYFEPNSRYESAKKLYDDGKYEEAIAAFENLDGFKDSEDHIKWANDAILQNKYDEALKLDSNNNHAGAIAILEELGDYKDCAEQVKTIKETYYSNLQQTYAYIYRGYDMDKSLAVCVYNALYASDLYDCYDSTVMSKLYSGSGYSTYYYWSRYYNGYATVVESDAAEAFATLLELTNENINQIDLLLLLLKNPPAEYEQLYKDIQDLKSAYDTYHSFVKKQPSVGYSSYDSKNNSNQKTVDAKISAIKKTDSKIADKVKEYAWKD